MDATDRRARNLVGISFAAIIYVLSGARFTEETFVFGSGIRVDSPGVLALAGVIIYVYAFQQFIRTHCKTSPWDLTAAMAVDLRGYLHKDPTLVRHSQKRFKAIAEERIRRPSKESQGAFVEMDWGKNPPVNNVDKVVPTAIKSPNSQNEANFPGAIGIRRGGLFAGVGAKDEERSRSCGGFYVPISPWVLGAAACKATAKTIWHSEGFWERIVPLVLGLIAGELITLHWLGMT